MEKCIGEILNSSLPNSNQMQSSCDGLCRDCGNQVEPVGNENFKFVPPFCKSCRDKRRRAEVREKRMDRVAQIKRVIASVIPPLYQKAHLRDLSNRLRQKMLELPPNKGLYLYGSAGVGKTYALCALLRFYILNRFYVRRTTWDALCLTIRDTYKHNAGETEQSIIWPYQDADIVVVEDIGTTVGIGSQESDFSLRTLLLILDYRLEHCKPTFITSNKSPDELGRSFDARVESRIYAACDIVPVTGRDKRREGETKMKISSGTPGLR